MKKLVLSIFCVVTGAVLAATSTPAGFTDNLEVALKDAKASGKYLYVCFSGSDWCGWCKRLEKEVFSDKDYNFAKALEKDYILVFIDNPNNKELLSEHAKANNRKLTSKYDIHGFPTALILDSDGERVEKTGYARGGAKPYVEKLLNIRKQGPELKKKNQLRKELIEKHIKPIDAKLEDFQKKVSQAFKEKTDLAALIPLSESLAKEVEATKVPAEIQDEIDRRVNGLKRYKQFVEMREKRLKERAAKEAAEKKEAAKDAK